MTRRRPNPQTSLDDEETLPLRPAQETPETEKYQQCRENRENRENRKNGDPDRVTTGAEALDATDEETYWRNEYRQRPSVGEEDWEIWEPAYRYGWESRARLDEERWEAVEERLAKGWKGSEGEPRLAWEQARRAIRDAWDRLSAGLSADEQERYWRAYFRTRPYVREGEDYELFAPAYRLGWDSKRRHPDGDWDELEERIAGEWNRLETRSSLTWERARGAVEDAWRRVERMLRGAHDRG
ncbi:MAG TPA: hypothetical protein VMV46_22035 [Thermoanaerobaculia bacterium]|nr:hypothetical protein [Thermoanaerobaculia bacterium]